MVTRSNSVALACILLLPVAVCPLEERLQVSTLSDAANAPPRCPHVFSMGCLLHVLTKVCAASQAIENCRLHGECKMRAVKKLTRLFKGEEAPIWRCCCDSTYPELCEESERGTMCKTAVQKRLLERISLKSIRKCAKNKRDSTCEQAGYAIDRLRAALQEAREKLRSSNLACKSFPPAQPMSICGWNVRPIPRPLGRADLECEVRRWQEAHDVPGIKSEKEQEEGDSAAGEEQADMCRHA